MKENLPRVSVILTAILIATVSIVAQTEQVTAEKSAGSSIQFSDQRLKRNVRPLSHSLSKLRILKPVNYQWNSVKPHDTVAVQTGFIAQDLEVVFPNLVKKETDGFKSINYLGLIPHLVQAIKELKIENEQLKIENAQLKKSTTKREKNFESRIHGLEVAVGQINAQAREK